jgi:hypothetical protein
MSTSVGVADPRGNVPISDWGRSPACPLVPFVRPYREASAATSD